MYQFDNYSKIQGLKGISIHLPIFIEKINRKKNYFLTIGREKSKESIDVFINDKDQFVFSLTDIDETPCKCILTDWYPTRSQFIFALR